MLIGIVMIYFESGKQKKGIKSLNAVSALSALAGRIKVFQYTIARNNSPESMETAHFETTGKISIMKLERSATDCSLS